MPQWPIENVKLSELDLDLLNVRVPAEGLDEPAIINYLMEEANLLELITGILRDGYIDNELPLVVVEHGRHVVLEGNRRVASLKVIHNPAILGEAGRRKVERLLSRFPGAELPPLLRVMIVPSREVTHPTLARLHTGLSKERWDRDRQAVFYHAQLSAMSVDQLRAKYPGEAAQITKFIRMGEMRRIIRGLRLDDRDLEEFVTSGRLKMSSLEYAYSKPKIQQALGLVFSADGLLPVSRVSEGQRRALIYLLERFKDKTLDTRSPELMTRTSQHEVLVAELTRLVANEVATVDDGAEEGDTEGTQNPTGRPSPGSRGGFGRSGESRGATSGATSSGAGSATKSSPDGGEAAGSQPGARGPNRGETRPYLNLDGFVYGGTSDGLRRRFEELRSLDLSKVPNATYDLLRTILECSIKDYFRAMGKPLPPGKTIGGCIEELAKEYQSAGNQRMVNFVNAINRKGKLPGEQYSKTHMALNASNHEPDSFVGQREVHEAWEHMKPILKEIVGK